MVYELLFSSKNEGKCITPDLEGTRHRNGIKGNAPHFSNYLPLLRTCQHIHAEATSVLYGSNVFYFSDEGHGAEKYPLIGFGISLPICDFVIMYGFLSGIGRKNRAKILQLQFDFSTTNFISYPDEGDGRPGSIFHDPGGGANCIGDTLELLSAKHNLRTFELSFNNDIGLGLYEYIHLFTDLSNRPNCSKRLLTKLGLLQDVGEVKCLRLTNA